jgi:hypothetical protein
LIEFLRIAVALFAISAGIGSSICSQAIHSSRRCARETAQSTCLLLARDVSIFYDNLQGRRKDC